MSVGIQSIYTFCVKMAPFNCCLFLHLLGLVHIFFFFPNSDSPSCFSVPFSQ